ncbi:MAG: alpha/beta fold hydrolase [Aureispira sp.]
MGSSIWYQQSKIAYQRSGQGTVLVLLHGFCEDSTMWADLVPLLSKKYSVLTIDLSGFGQSDLLKESSIAAMANAVYAVWKTEQLDAAVLIGHSMGGYVGLELAAQYPDCLLGLGLLHSHPFADSEEKINNRLKTIAFVERHGIAPFAGQFVRNLFPAAFVQEHKALIEELVHQTSLHHSDAVVAASKAMIGRKDHRATLQALACPVLMVVGTADKAIATPLCLAQLALPSTASIHILEGVGHMAHVEAPAETLEIMVDFLEFCEHQASLSLSLTK